MNETIGTINQWAQLALTVCGIVTAVVAALAGTKLGKSKAVQTAADITGIIQDVARIAVQATEQNWRKSQIPAQAPDVRNEHKRDEALKRARQLLPAGVTPAPGQLESAIEAAVGAMNTRRAEAAR